MTRQDYALLAKAISQARTANPKGKAAAFGIGLVAGYIGLALAEANPRFDADKFKAACMEDQS